MSNTPAPPIQTPGDEPILTPEAPLELVDASLPEALGGVAPVAGVDDVGEIIPAGWTDPEFVDGEGMFTIEEAPE